MTREFLLPKDWRPRESEESDFPHGLSRRALLAFLIGAGAAMAGLSGDTGPDPIISQRPERLADIRNMTPKEMVAAIDATFRYDSHSGLYIESTDEPKSIASVWPFSDMRALLELAASQGIIAESASMLLIAHPCAT